MAKKNMARFGVVAGSFAFPMDMARYDGCYPASEDESGRIERTREPGAHGMQFVVLQQDADHGAPWNGDRWRSFGWRLLGTYPEKYTAESRRDEFAAQYAKNGLDGRIPAREII